MFARWALVVGEKGSGRSALVHAAAVSLVSRGLRVGGFVQQAVQTGDEQKGYRVVRVGAQGIEAIARPGTPQTPSEEAFCSFVFDADAFARVAAWIEPTSEVLVLDEVSKLEAAGRGHAEAIRRALACPGVVVLGVRAEPLAAVMDRFELGEPLAVLDAAAPALLDEFVAQVAVAARPA